MHRRVSPGRYRAMTALLLLLPGTPMLFQGQEFGSSSPFLYFADHQGELARGGTKGTRRVRHAVSQPGDRRVAGQHARPHDWTTFERCKLHWDERAAHAGHRRLHVDLLALRRDDAAFQQQKHDAIDGAVLGHEAFVLNMQCATPVTNGFCS